MISQSDLVQRFGETELIELTDPNCEAINEETLNLAIADAIAEAESYVGKIANAPEVLNATSPAITYTKTIRLKL